MKRTNRFVYDMLDGDTAEAAGDLLRVAGRCTDVDERAGRVILTVPFHAYRLGALVERDETRPCETQEVVVRAYGDSVIRISSGLGAALPDDDTVMLQMDASLKEEPLTVNKSDAGWELLDGARRLRWHIPVDTPSTLEWSDLVPRPEDRFEATVSPDETCAIPFMAYDTFFPRQVESVPLGYVERGEEIRGALFSFHARSDERFIGGGERFRKMNLAGETLVLENDDTLGVNSRRAYKNVPFYVSSRGYGLLILTSAHVRLSLADISTRAAQGLVEDDSLDLFIIGGGSVEAIVRNYRKLTGFPPEVPVWSYGMWMSRMTYFSADEVRDIGKRLRQDNYPCDVLHVDTGWFETDWQCDWKFSEKSFPNAAAFLDEMKRSGFRITLWQTPYLNGGNKRVGEALASDYLWQCADREGAMVSDFQDNQRVGAIDFSNPAAVEWYQGMLADLLRQGVAAIKTDFGENPRGVGDAHSVPARLMHNLYALLYQKAAFDVTKAVTGEGLIWARAGWIGCQRYPVHWGGDAAATWDGLAASLRGGLHLGCSGFAYWSHDIPGFHGLPDFMNSRLDDTLYVRWTQFGVLSSHMRYHGTSPREPWHFPEVADVVRPWLRLRYALIPYLVAQGRCCAKTGYPILRALVFHHDDDPFCWRIDDQYFFGENMLVAPVLDASGVRDVYLPEGSWTDFWTGEVIRGPVRLRNIESDLSRIPIYARTHATIPVYPEAVTCTDEMDLTRSVPLTFDAGYTGPESSPLAWCGLQDARKE